MPEGYNNQGYGSGGYPRPQQPPIQGMSQQGMPQPQQGMPQPRQGMPQPQQPPVQGIPQPQPGYPYGGYPQGQQPPMGEMPQYGYPEGQPPKKGLGIGAIIGIVVGAVALVGIVLMLVVIPMIGRNDDTLGDQDDTTTTTPAPTDDSGTGDATDATQDAGTSDATDNPTDGTESPAPSVAPSGVAVDINNLADDWTLGEVNLAGQGYQLFESTYGDLVANGWALSEFSRDEIVQNSGSLIINAGQWETFTFENPTFPDCSLTVGLGNTGSAPINYDQCVITYLAGRAPYSDGKVAYDKVYDFVVSKGIKFGMTDQEVLAAFGQPDDHGSVYEDTDSGYKSIKYVVIGDGKAFQRGYYHLDFGFKLEDDGQYRINDISIGA